MTKFANGEGTASERFKAINWVGVIAEGKLKAFGSAAIGGLASFTLDDYFKDKGALGVTIPILKKPQQGAVNIASGTLGNYIGDFAIGSKRLSGSFSDEQIKGVGKFGVEYFGNQLGDQSGSAAGNAINDYLEK